MSDALYFAPLRTPLTDSRTGLMSREWYLFFQALWLRTGGLTGSDDNALLQSGGGALSAADILPSVIGLGQDLNQVPQVEVAQLFKESLIAAPPPASYSELDKLIQDLGQSPPVMSQVVPFLQYGSWTPIDVSGAGLALVVGSASYVKLDRLVFVRCLVTYPATASGASATIGGFPFIVDNNDAARQGWISFATTANARFFLPVNNATNAFIYQNAGVAATNAQMSTAALFLSALYTTAP
jgi:hypothetical protein